MATSVGFIGVGNMGNPMAGNVLKNFPLTVFDLNPAAASNLIAAGARKAGSVQEVLEQSDVVMTCLPASPDVEALYLSPGGLIERARRDTILIDLSSVLHSTPRKLEPKAITIKNVKSVVDAGFVDAAKLCAGDYKKACQRAGIQ